MCCALRASCGRVGCADRARAPLPQLCSWFLRSTTAASPRLPPSATCTATTCSWSRPPTTHMLRPVPPGLHRCPEKVQAVGPRLHRALAQPGAGAGARHGGRRTRLGSLVSAWPRVAAGRMGPGLHWALRMRCGCCLLHTTAPAQSLTTPAPPSPGIGWVRATRRRQTRRLWT